MLAASVIYCYAPKLTNKKEELIFNFRMSVRGAIRQRRVGQQGALPTRASFKFYRYKTQHMRPFENPHMLVLLFFLHRALDLDPNNNYCSHGFNLMFAV